MGKLSSKTLRGAADFSNPAEPLSLMEATSSQAVFPVETATSVFVPTFIRPVLALRRDLSIATETSNVLLVDSSSPLTGPFYADTRCPPGGFAPATFTTLSEILTCFVKSPPTSTGVVSAKIASVHLLVVKAPCSFSVSSPILAEFSTLQRVLSWVLPRTLSTSRSTRSEESVPVIVIHVSEFSSQVVLVISDVSYIFVVRFFPCLRCLWVVYSTSCWGYPHRQRSSGIQSFRQREEFRPRGEWEMCHVYRHRQTLSCGACPMGSVI